MDFEAVVTCLENKERREEFIARLKKAGEYSSPVLQVQNAMTELNMHKAPKGIFEKTMLQNIFQNFCEPDKCFQTFRLVCKQWKNAVETIRFDQYVDEEIFYELDEAITNQAIISTNYFDKYLPAFKQLCMPMTEIENKNEIFSLTLKNMKKLNELFLTCYEKTCGPEYDTFIFEMVENSRNTLSVLSIPKFTIPNANFPKMKRLSLSIGKDISRADFETHFPLVLKNMENLNKVKLYNMWDHGSVCQYIVQNYQQHCIHGFLFDNDILNYIPLKITTMIFNLEKTLDNKIYASHLQYAHIHIRAPRNPMMDGWDRYRDIFDQCTNVKAIELDASQGRSRAGKNFVQDVLPTLSWDVQEIWNERITYFEARGIRLAEKGDILNNGNLNENLENKLAKEAGIKWRFHFF